LEVEYNILKLPSNTVPHDYLRLQCLMYCVTLICQLLYRSSKIREHGGDITTVQLLKTLPRAVNTSNAA